MKRIGIVMIALFVTLGLGQDEYAHESRNCLKEKCEYMFALRPDARVVERFLKELENRGFAPDTARFSQLLEDGTLVNLEKEDETLRSYLDIGQRNNGVVGSLFPLYTTAIADPNAKVDTAPCGGLMAFVKDLNSLPEDEAIKLLQQVREVLEREFGANVAYGPNPDGSGGGGGSQTQFTEATTFSQNTYYAFQPTGTNNVTIAVLDTGVGGLKDEFISSGAMSVVPGYDFVESDTDPSDTYTYEVPPPPNPASITFHQHGSPVAYIASATTQQSSGTLPKIMPVKVCGNNDSTKLDDDCRVSDIIIGVCYALANYNPSGEPNERLVINLSLGGEKPVDMLGEVLWQGMDEGAVIIASGGNDRYFHENYQESYYPGAFECRPSDKVTVPNTSIEVCPPSPSSSPTYDSNGLIAVSSVDGSGTRSVFSVRALYNDVAALGEYTVAPLENRHGTSYATPVISGIAATILSQHPTAKPHEVEACIRTMAQAAQPLNPTLGIGVGILEAATTDIGLCSFSE